MKRIIQMAVAAVLSSESSTFAEAERPPLDAVRVTKVCKYGTDDAPAGLGDMITLRVKHLENLTNAAKCLDPREGRVADCQPQRIALFLAGRKIKGLFPESGAPVPKEQRDTDDGILQFHLQRTAESDEEWGDLLGGPTTTDLFIRPTEVSVGLENEFPVGTDVKEFPLIRIRQVQFVICLLLLIAIGIGLLWLAGTKEILRTIGPSPTQLAPNGKLQMRPYSLARCQMAWWFFWVVASFAFIWQITGALDIITSSTLALLGIGAGTALGSTVVDANRLESNNAQLQALKAEQQTLQTEITALEDQISRAASPRLGELEQKKNEKTTRLKFVELQIREFSRRVNPQTSRGFFKDVITENDEISFHRFQMFVWTIVLSVVFLASVYTRLSMPEFSTSLLALQGIVSGTYLGFKFPGK